ncbi:MAG: hypothetical protein PHY47_00225 [Lachnospiraceae bacterium]|nr:hypothetical protein [Lachnospiraceae bacterium]
MALFSIKPPVVTKQIAAQFTIDYNGIAEWSVIPEGYYKDINNWKEVFVRFKHEGSNQKGTVHFKRPGTTANLLLTDAARAGTWKVDSVVIRDFDKGDFPIFANQIPSLQDYNFLVQSNATHGDLYVGAGQTVTIPAGSKRQYGDFVIEAGGILEIDNGGGITEIEINESCLINGTIKANNGKHLSGSWNKTSVLGEPLSYSIVQKAGGNGGEGQAGVSLVRVPATGQIYSAGDLWHVYKHTASGTEKSAIYVGGVVIADNLPYTATEHTIGDKTYYRGTLRSTGGDQVDLVSNMYDFHYTEPGILAGGIGGLALDGNGGGGGRASTFGALKGGDAVTNQAGIGAGQDDAPADAYGEEGAPSITASEAGSGGFRGAHGQGLYLKARKIQGTGTINAGGQKGGDGGNGGQYDNGGIFYGNGAGGGGAGGSGGKIWLRYKIGTPALSLVVTGGDKGNRGTRPNTEVEEAMHGEAGDVGSINLATW